MNEKAQKELKSSLVKTTKDQISARPYLAMNQPIQQRCTSHIEIKFAFYVRGTSLEGKRN